MLIKTQVKRRTEIINNYILSVKQKVFNKKYKQAIQMLKYSRESINNSYIAPYDPNAFLLDSLKAKNEKLRKQKKVVQMRLMERLEDINKVKQKRGYTKQSQTYGSLQPQFIQKLCAEEVGAYASRLNLKLTDVERIDYDPITLQTNFHALRILLDDASTTIPFRSIISVESQEAYMLICWRTDKNINHSYMIIKFDHQEQRIIWSRCIMFCRLINESEFKGKLFFKQQPYQVNIKQQKSQKRQANERIVNDFSEKNSSIKNFNLNIGNNKSPAYDRLRRKSQYTPHGPSFNIGLGLKNRSKSRKTSEDLSLKEAFNKNYLQKRLLKERSQKSFQQDSNSMVGKLVQESKRQPPKEPIKKIDTNAPTAKIQKLIQERQKLQSEHKNNSSNTQSNRQIFFNESSIHWIQQQNDEQKSKTSSRNSNPNKNVSQNKIMSLDIFSKEHLAEHSQHISQVPAQTQQSPLLPYNLRQAKKNQKKEFKVEMKEVLTSSGKKKQKSQQLPQNKLRQSVDKKSNSSKNYSAGLKKQKMGQLQNNNSMEEEEFEDQEIDGQIEVANQYSQGYEESPDKIKGHGSKNLQIEDKSQDLVSENEESQTQSRKYGLDDLKFGIMVLKCSSSGWKAHIKKLFLSNNDSQICWKNEKGDDLKKINISDIQKIQYGVITLGITKHIKNIQKRRCMSIKYKNNNQFKLLEFYLPEKQPIDHIQQFYQKLNVYVRYKNTHEL